MIDNDIKVLVDEISEYTERINIILADLHTKNVEVRFLYKDSGADTPPCLSLWRATEHVDYLKDDR